MKTSMRAFGITVAACLLAVRALARRRPIRRSMARAKDFIADEQWASAIGELQAAVADAKEPSRDEALFWLAHSQNQNAEPVAALQTIDRLEREFPASRWVRFAQSLRIEIAQR